MEKIGLEGVFETAGFQRGLATYVRGLAEANRSTNLTASAMSTLGASGTLALGALSAAAVAAVAVVTLAMAGIVTAIGGVGFAAINTAVSVESAWASVLKTTDGLIDEFGNLTAAGEEVRNGFRELAQSVPVKLEDLMELGALAAQLGVAEDQLVGFTETMAALGVSTNLSSEEAAQAIAQMQNIFDIAAGDMADNASRVGSALVALGNNFATTERDIMNFASRIAGAGQIAGLSQADILGIGAAMASVGVEAEAGGTAVQKVLLEIQEAVSTGNAKLAEFADVAGLSVQEFQQAWETDAAGAFTAFVEGLGAAGDDAIQILADLGLEDQRLIRSFLSLAGAGDLLADAITASNEAFAANVALSEEANRRYATTAAQWQILKNTLRDILLVIGDKLLPIVNQFVSAGIEAAQVWGPKIAEAIGPAIDALSKFFDTLMQGEFGTELLPALAGALEQLIGAGAGADFSWMDALAAGINFISSALAGLINTGDLGGFLTQLGIPPETVESLIQFGQWLSQVVTDIMTFLGENVNLQDVLIGLGVVIAAAVIPTIISLVSTLAPLIATILLVIAAAALLRAAWEQDWLGIRTALTDFWEGTAQPALQQLATWLGTNIPVAIQALSDFWLNTLQPALMTVWTFVTESLLPTLGEFATFLSGVFSQAVAALASVWETVLQPALNIVWGFVQGSLFPLLQAVSDFISAVFNVAVTAMAGIWQNVLQPALMAVWAVIANQLKPVFEDISNFISGTVGPVVEGLASGALAALKAAFDNLAGIIETIIGNLETMTGVLNNITLPDWMTPGSPTPWEIGLRGVNEALGELTRLGLPRFGSALEQIAAINQAMQDMTVGRAGQMLPGAAALGGQSVTNIYHSYEVNANYVKTQTPATIMDDLVLTNALSGAG